MFVNTFFETFKNFSVFVIKHAVTVALEIGISDLFPEFLADALVLRGLLQAAGAVAVLCLEAFSDCFDKMKQAFYDLGAAKAVKFGDADCILCDANKIFEVCKKLFAIEETCIIEREEIPESWWKN